MKKQNRILKNAEFSHIMKTGKKIHSQTMSFFFTKNPQDTFRIGISISKKVSKLAVIRNLIKRRINAILVDDYDKKKNYNIIIIAKPLIKEKKFSDIKHEINEFLKKI